MNDKSIARFAARGSAALSCLAALLACVPGGSAFGQSAAPSFDCRRADGSVERLICEDADLAALDRNLAAVYEQAMRNFPTDSLDSERATQRGWISGRNECWKADDVRQCTDEAYRTRIVELQIRSGQLMAPNAVTYTCEGQDLPLWAAFYNQTAPRSVVLTLGNDQVIAFITRTASGARYVAAGVDFWEHQREATVNFFGTELRCVVDGG